MARGVFSSRVIFSSVRERLKCKKSILRSLSSALAHITFLHYTYLITWGSAPSTRSLTPLQIYIEDIIGQRLIFTLSICIWL